MKIKRGYIVKIADIGTLGTIVRVGENGEAAVVEFNFPEGRIEGTLPVSIISGVISRGKTYEQARI